MLALAPYTLAWAVVLASLALAVPTRSGAAGGPGRDAAGALVPVMQELARAFDGLDRAVATGDDHLVARHAAVLARVAADKALASGRTSEERRDFDDHARALRTAVNTLPRGTPSDARAGVDDIRRACTRCHVQFRDWAASAFPAIANTVAGVVEVRRPDGAARPNRPNVAVFLEGVPRAARDVRTSSTVSQKDRRFSPRVLPVVRGDIVHFPNDDTVFHNVFSRSEARPFDLGTYASGARRSVAFPQPGLVKVYCNIHPDMVLSVLVLASPFFDVTDDAGHFAITGVPDGTFTLRAWHEGGGDTRQQVMVQGGVVQRLSLSVKETRRSIEHLDKFGQPYRRKY